MHFVFDTCVKNIKKIEQRARGQNEAYMTKVRIAGSEQTVPKDFRFCLTSNHSRHHLQRFDQRMAGEQVL